MSPESIFSYNLWSSCVFHRNSNLCLRRQFGNIGTLINYLADIIKSNHTGTTFITVEEFETRFNHAPDVEHFTSLRLVISLAVSRLGLNFKNIAPVFPILPLFLQLINYSNSGCNAWSRLLKKLSFKNEGLEIRERKWETFLGAMQGNFFWERAYKFTADIFFNNKIKWFQYQITRGTLKTNYIVSKFIPVISPMCSFCGIDTETILHLFYDCTVIRSFYISAYSIMSNHWNSEYSLPALKPFIFGNSTIPPHNHVNFLALHLKYFVWLNRCKKRPLCKCFYELASN